MSLDNLPRQNWGKNLEWSLLTSDVHPQTRQPIHLRIFSVEAQARLIQAPVMVGIYAEELPAAVLVKAFEKNYSTPSKPNVVKAYGFKQEHAEPIELMNFVYEVICDRACEGELNRYRYNSKNWESGRYADYLTHGLTIVWPEDCNTPERRNRFLVGTVVPDLLAYCEAILSGERRQDARRRIGEYRAVEGVLGVNLRSLWHMGRQRSAELSPNGREAEPQISRVVTQMVKEALPHVHPYEEILLEMIGEGYR